MLPAREHQRALSVHRLCTAGTGRRPCAGSRQASGRTPAHSGCLQTREASHGQGRGTHIIGVRLTRRWQGRVAADSDLEAWRASRGSWQTYATATSRGAFTTLQTHREEVAYRVSAAEERPEGLVEISWIAPLAIEEVARWSKDTSSKSNERLRSADSLIRKNSHSFRGFIAVVLPPFPGRHNYQSFLSRFDYGGAPFPGRLTKKCDLRHARHK